MNTLKTPSGRKLAGMPEAGQETSLLFDEISRLHSALTAALGDMAKDYGLSGGRWKVLTALEDGSATVASIARMIGLTRQSVQRSMDNLATSGFVEYRDNPDHKRAKLARLTDKGTSALAELSAKQAAWFTEISSDLPPANIRIATGIIRGLVGRV